MVVMVIITVMAVFQQLITVHCIVAGMEDGRRGVGKGGGGGGRREAIVSQNVACGYGTMMVVAAAASVVVVVVGLSYE